MSAHVLLVALGPVQEFIAQARRTRDLWYGSHLLSELGRAGARALVAGGAHLVFPALQGGDAELEPCQAPTRTNGEPPLNIANKLLAEVPPGVDPAALAREARAAVFAFWRQEVAARVKAECAGLLAPAVDAVWDEQVETFLEFAASWAPLDDYAHARRRLEQGIAGRKALRDFSPWTRQRGTAPKSSLDGARETVLRPAGQRDTRLVRRYRIAEGEQLDAVGLVKRAGGDPEQFVPVINIALASWIELAAREAPGELDALREACRHAGVPRVARPDLPCARPFPFDASVLLPSRWRSMSREQGLPGDPDAWGRRHVGPVLDKMGEAHPYVACLVADGDRMGRALDALGSADEHREFSRALSRFAADARRIVEQRHRGVLVYAGGDDVLAFHPLPEALACAEDLRRHFAGAMGHACARLPAAERPTLSIGLGVGHVMESMGDLLTLAREAERDAKRDRNALALLVDKRSGSRRSWRSGWDEDPAGRLRADAVLLQERLSSRKVYEVARTLQRAPAPTAADGDGPARLLALEVRRSLARAGEAGLRPEEVGLLLEPEAGYAVAHRRVRAWVDRMLIARVFSQATPRPHHPGEEVPA